MSNLKTSSFCLFCYKSITDSSKTSHYSDNIKKFIKILNQFATSQIIKPSSYDNFYKDNLSDCCNKCNCIITSFCDRFHELKMIELQLEHVLDILVEKINHANKVPTRWIEVNRVLEKVYLSDLDKKMESQIKIRKFRQNIVKAGHQRNQLSQPRVLLCRAETNIQLAQSSNSPENTGNEMKSRWIQKPVKEHVNIKAVLDDYSEDIDNDVEMDQYKVYMPAIENTMVEGLKSFDNGNIERSNVELIEGTANFMDPQIQIKMEHHLDVENKTTSIQCKSLPQEHTTNKILSEPENIRKKPSNDKILKCSKCIKEFKSKKGLRIHEEVHGTDHKKFKCKICQKRCLTKLGLQFHLKVHTERDQFKCRFCGRMYLHMALLGKHLKEIHVEEKEEIRKVWREIKTQSLTKTRWKNQRESLIKDRYKFSYCPYCKEPFPFLHSLKAHLRNSRCSIRSSQKMKLSCEECGKEFNLDIDLWTHQKEVHKEKVCLECGKQFRKTSNLNLHLEFHKDPKEWKFECEICGKKCVTSSKAKVHKNSHLKKNFQGKTKEVRNINRVSEKPELNLKEGQDERNLQLKKGFKGKTRQVINLNRNMMKNELNLEEDPPTVVRDQNERLKCGKCEKVWVGSKKELWLHQKQVHKEKVCLNCGKTFQRCHHLTLHLEYHKHSSEWKFECEICGKKCPSKGKLTEHVGRHSRKNFRPRKFARKMVSEDPESNVGKIIGEMKSESVTVTVQKQSRYGLGNHCVTNFSTVENDDDDDNKESNYEKCDNGKINGKELNSVDAKDLHVENGGFDEMKKFDKILDDPGLGGELSENEVNILEENILWTTKGNCFGDGNLVEFEDLD